MEALQEQELRNQLEQTFMNMLESYKYTQEIQEMLGRKQRRLLISLDDIRQQDPKVLNQVVFYPAQSIKVFEEVLSNIVRGLAEMTKLNNFHYKVAFGGNFGVNHVSPRGLSAQLLNQLVQVQGIVTRMTIVRQKIGKSVHFVEETNRTFERFYSDQYDLQSQTDGVQRNIFPTTDANGHPVLTEYGESVYKDVQILAIQELPERTPKGQLPRSVNIILEDDLCDQTKPGDRIDVVGIYRPITLASSNHTGVFRNVLIANNIQQLQQDQSQQIMAQDIKQIKEIGQSQNALQLLANSLVPSIHGHDMIKKALILMLLSGVEHNLQNGTHIRGDINILLIGDPSTAKSQMLRSIMNIAPLVINTTGRGASGVGLTAAVSYNVETNERTLEAGAMVLADRGVVCIDEFDKMGDADRVAIHEVMEQQTVTISKAGIHTSLNARCSVLAAANPLYGNYLRDKSPAYNIALPESLLSRFDLLFIVLDQQQADIDRRIAGQVIMNHSYNGKASVNDMDLDYDVVEPEPMEEQETEQTFVMYQDKQLLSRNFMKKYLKYAKQRIKPQLGEKARDAIQEAWVELRQQDVHDGRKKIVKITIRTLETLIRLSCAVAKAHLSQEVRKRHVKEAHSLMRYAIYYEDTTNQNIPQSRQTKSRLEVSSPQKRSKTEMTEGEEVQQVISYTAEFTDEQVQLIQQQLMQYPGITVDQTVSLDNFYEFLQREVNIDQGLLLSILRYMDSKGKIVFSEDESKIYLI